MADRKRLTIGPLSDGHSLNHADHNNPIVCARRSMWGDWIDDCASMAEAWGEVKIETMLSDYARLKAEQSESEGNA
jgi:hypothetical protein